MDRRREEVLIGFWREMSPSLCSVQFLLSSVLVFSKTVRLIIDPLSMDRFRTVIHWFSLISVRFSSVQQFGSVFGFFCSPLNTSVQPSTKDCHTKHRVPSINQHFCQILKGY